MVIDYEESREKVEKVLAGELDLPAQELWPLIYYLKCMIRDPKSDQEYMDKALVLFEKMLKKVDQDEDDEMELVIEAAYELIGWEGPVEKILELMAEAEVNFTEPRYYQRELTNIRDYLLENRLSARLVSKLAQLGVDLDEALVKGRTPAYIVANKQRMSSWGSGRNLRDPRGDQARPSRDAGGHAEEGREREPDGGSAPGGGNNAFDDSLRLRFPQSCENADGRGSGRQPG